METVCIKMEDSLAQAMEQTMKYNHYTTKTEFIREAIRDKMVALRLAVLKSAYGISRRKTTDAMLHRAREKAVKDIKQGLARTR